MKVIIMQRNVMQHNDDNNNYNDNYINDHNDINDNSIQLKSRPNIYIYIYTYIYTYFFLFLFFGTLTSTVYESDTYNETQIWRKSRFDKIFTRAEP